MPENLFKYYVLGGGWVMIFLIPASIVALATIFRVAGHLRGSAVKRLSNQLRATVIAHKHSAVSSMDFTDARMLAADASMGVYVSLQPLSVIYAVAPMLGAVGSAWSLMLAWRGAASLQNKNLAAALEHAFIPLGWGVLVGLLSITGYAVLRARLVRIEIDILAPAAMAALGEPREGRNGQKF